MPVKPSVRHDIPVLVDWFLAQSCQRIGRELAGISAADLAKLQNYSYPGNGRELANLIERADARTEHTALLQNNGNKAAAARSLSIDRSTLYRKL